LSTKIVVPGCGTLTMQRQHASSSQRTGTTHRDQTTRALAAWSPETGPLLSRDQHEAIEIALYHTLGKLPEPEFTHEFC
jgi:PIN domain nuclease of toxin-antitoxin system